MGCGNNNTQCSCTDPIQIILEGPAGPTGPAGSSGQAVLYNTVGTSTVNTLAAGLEEVLDTYTLPASGGGGLTLSVNDDYIEIVNHFSYTNDVPGHIVKLKFGATYYFAPIFSINSKTNYTSIYRTRIHRTGAATQQVTTTLELYTSGFLVTFITSPITGIAEDLSTTTAIVTTYIATAPAGAGSITHKGMSVTIFKKS